MVDENNVIDVEVFTKVKALREEINRLIEERPVLRALQDEIDRRLATASSQHNRLAIIQDLMFTKFRELSAAMQDLKSSTEVFNTLVQEIKEDDSEKR